MPQRSAPPVKATRTSFEIIETLRELDGAGVKELADHLNLPNSTTHDHLKTLEESEYLVKRGEKYHVGMRFLDLGGYARQQMDLFRIAQPEMRALANETNEHVNLMIEEHGYGVFLHTVKGEEAVQLDTHSGRRVYLHTTALGKAILANMPEERVEEILENRGLPKRTDKTVSNRSDLYDRLDKIRDRGYATDDEERIEGMRCVAAPICSEGAVLGAVSVSGPRSKMEGDYFENELPKRVNRIANVIEVNTKYL